MAVRPTISNLCKATTVIVATLCALVTLTHIAYSRAEDARATLTIRKTQFFPSQDVTSTLTIENTTKKAISWTPVSVIFLIRHEDGHTDERRWITTITRPIRPIQIGPRERRNFDIPLPKCKVITDPCTQRVAIRTDVTVSSTGPSERRFVALQTREQSFTIVPDPDATFDLDGLPDNVPLFATRGEDVAVKRQATELSAFVGGGAIGQPISNDGDLLYFGDHRTTGAALLPKDLFSLAYLGGDTTHGLDTTLPIAGDRPELLAIGRIRIMDADRLGMRSTEAAAGIALLGLDSFANDLGVSLGPISLIAADTQPGLDPEEGVGTAYVARASTGELDLVWNAFALPEPTPTAPATPDPSAGQIGVRPHIVMPDPPLVEVPIALEAIETQIAAKGDIPYPSLQRRFRSIAQKRSTKRVDFQSSERQKLRSRKRA